MSLVLKLLSAAGLGLTIVPAFLVFAGRLTWEAHANLVLAGTILWFVTAPFWMKTGDGPVG
ncbi:hypothetical protein AWN76_013965 [Rhodothermaceae bacterium RA]|nr:hypothetical protein AWN76_013965 [Rhodothermaceae bacterium RA]